MGKSFKKFVNEKIENVKSSPSGDPLSFLSQDKFVRKDRVIRKRGQYRTAVQNLTKGIKGQSEIDAAADAIRDMKSSGKMGKITTDVKQAARNLKDKMFTADGGKKITTVVRDKSGQTIANPPTDRGFGSTKTTSGQTTNVGGGVVTDKDLRDASKVKNPEKFADTAGQTDTKPKQNVVKKKPSTQYRQLQNKARGILKDLAKEKTAGKNVIRPKLDFDLTGNKIDDSVKSVRTNRRNINKVYKPNVTRTRGSGITVNKGRGATTSSSNLNKIVNKKSTNIIDKVFGSGDTKITTNITDPDLKRMSASDRATYSKIKASTPKGGMPKGTVLPDGTIKPETVNKVKTQTQQPLKGFKQFRADSITRRGATNVAKGLAGKATKVLGIAGLALDAGKTFRDTYKTSQAQGHSKQRSIGKSLAKIGGGIVGGALGGTVGSVAGPGGSFVGAGLGYAGGKELGGRAFDKLTTQQGRDELKQSFKNFRKRAMKPVGA